MTAMRALLPAFVAMLAGVALAGRVGGQPAGMMSVALVPGWNNIAYLGPSVPIEQALAPLAGSYGSVWEFDATAQTFRAYHPQAPLVSDLRQLTAQRAFWIQMLRPAVFTYQVQPPPDGLLLFPGLNNVPYVGQEAPVGEVLAPLAARVRSVWRWDAPGQRWQAAVPGVPQASDFATFAPGRAYTIQLSDGAPATLRGPEVARPAPSASPAARGCYSFQSRQPELAELRTAFNRAGHGRLIDDPSFALPQLETQHDGDGGLVPGYVPPTLLKAIAWTESSWRHAGYEVQRGMIGRTLTSSSCAFGVMQVLTDMEIRDQPTPRQALIGGDYRHNIAAGVRILAEKWNVAPSVTPVVRFRQPHVIEDWYYAVWAYHCYGERCTRLGLHDNPDDPALTWPRPVYNSPEQLNSRGRFTRADYPYQELVFGLIQHPPRADGQPLWTPLPVKLPPPGTVSHPQPKPFDRPGLTIDPTRADEP